MVSESYARSTGPLAKAGAAYMKIMNHSKKDDHLISVYSDIAKKTELHTHLKSDNGVMKMMHIDNHEPSVRINFIYWFPCKLNL